MTRFNLITVFNALLHRRLLCITTTAVLLLFAPLMRAQNVGVGTSTPLRKLSVTGSIMVDQNNNNMGTVDSAALVFGSAGNSGISSRKTGVDQHNLSFWTAGIPYMNLSPTGNLGVGGDYGALYRLWVRNGNSRVDGDLYTGGELTAIGNSAIGGNVDPLYRLRVYNGDTRFGGEMHATGNVAFGGDVDPLYRLRVIGGNTRFGGDMHATGNVGVGGLPDPAYQFRVLGNGNARFDGNMSTLGLVGLGGATDPAFRLRVYNGNTRLGGDLEVTGDVTIGGKGSVRSNGTSPLRIGFDQVSVNEVIAANQSVAVLANITDFTGDNDDVRIMISHFVPAAVGSTLLWANIIVSISNVSSGSDTCLIWLHNRTGAQGSLAGTIYFTTIAKN